MKLMAMIVFYNPDSRAISNYNNLKNCKYFDKVYVYDNSSNLTSIDIDEHIEYDTCNKNMGIAYALKRGLDYAVKNSYDYILTLDQDSIFNFDDMPEIIKHLEKHISDNTGIVALNYNDKFKSNKDEIFVKTIITSGNFINVSNYKLIDGFNTDLFIDYVDYDLCRQFYYKNKKIVLLPKFSIKQTIGNPIYKKFLFLNIKCMNASLVRYYYRFRNLTYCYRRNKKFYFKLLIKENITILFTKLYEENKKEKLAMIKKGKKDGKKGVLGPYGG